MGVSRFFFFKNMSTIDPARPGPYLVGLAEVARWTRDLGGMIYSIYEIPTLPSAGSTDAFFI